MPKNPAKLVARLMRAPLYTSADDAGHGKAGISITTDPVGGGLVLRSATDTYNPALGTGTYQILLKTSDGQFYASNGNIIIGDDGTAIIPTTGAVATRAYRFVRAAGTELGGVYYEDLVTETHIQLANLAAPTGISLTEVVAHSLDTGSAIVALTADFDELAQQANVTLTASTSGTDIELQADVTRVTELLFINDIANTKMTIGLTINQGAADNEAVALKSSDVAHGVTDVAETDTYGTLAKFGATDGGLQITGIGELAQGLGLVGIATNDDANKSASASSPIRLIARKKSGTGIADMGADANLVTIWNNDETRWLADEDGDTWQAGGVTIGTDVTMGDPGNIVLGTSTGTKIGTATSQKLGFYNAAPVDQPGAYTQTYSTADKTHANPTAAVLTVTDGAGTNDNTIGAITGDASVIAAVQELADEINKLVADVADVKALVNSVIDDLQELGLVG